MAHQTCKRREIKANEIENVLTVLSPLETETEEKSRPLECTNYAIYCPETDNNKNR